VAEAQPLELASGSFVFRVHQADGAARVFRLSDGRVIVRFESFGTSNGPVLVVWWSKNPARGESSAFSDDHVEMGSLKGNIGDQNDIVPPDVDITPYASVVVWCDCFDVPSAPPTSTRRGDSRSRRSDAQDQPAPPNGPVFPLGRRAGSRPRHGLAAARGHRDAPR
jgi:electron transfer DM13